jgi:hypothetical protein
MPKCYPVSDENGEFLRWVDADEAHELVAGRQAETLWHKTRIWGLRMIAVDPLPERPVALRRRGFGDSHRHETDRNPPNVWTIDYLQKWARLELLRVLEGCRPPKDLIPRNRVRSARAKRAG